MLLASAKRKYRHTDVAFHSKGAFYLEKKLYKKGIPQIDVRGKYFYAFYGALLCIDPVYEPLAH